MRGTALFQEQWDRKYGLGFEDPDTREKRQVDAALEERQLPHLTTSGTGAALRRAPSSSLIMQKA